jgi:signal transduction histidine kinase
MWRRFRLTVGRSLRRVRLTYRFLAVSILVIAFAMVALGWAISATVRDSITEGVAKTAAASVDSLVANAVGAILGGPIISDDDRARIDALFEFSSDAETTRLIQIRIFDLHERLLYEASDGVIDQAREDRFTRAKAGEVSSDLVELPLVAAGPVGSHPISLLRLYTPLHEVTTGKVFAVAALYYSAKSVFDIQAKAQTLVWSVVLLVGIMVIALLYAFVAAAERTIVRQARSLTTNLARSRQLSDEVRGLHEASEGLRRDAIDANEQLLARVGSDIHDGPLQLMTLAIFQLSQLAKTDQNPTLTPTVDLTTEAVAELRNISAGLVLPELGGLTLAQTLELAIARHEGATGSAVTRNFEGVDHAVVTDIQVALYRVVQESLSNAFRHSDGRNQVVVAEHIGEAIAVEISNAAGQVVTGNDAKIRPRLGLRGMRLRLEAVGGSMTVEMRQDRTIVRAVVPARSSGPTPDGAE